MIQHTLHIFLLSRLGSVVLVEAFHTTVTGIFVSRDLGSIRIDSYALVMWVPFFPIQIRVHFVHISHVPSRALYQSHLEAASPSHFIANISR